LSRHEDGRSGVEPDRPFGGTPGMGVISTVKVRSGGWRAPATSQRQGCRSRGRIWRKPEANARAKVHELDLRQGKPDELPAHNEIRSRQRL